MSISKCIQGGPSVTERRRNEVMTGQTTILRRSLHESLVAPLREMILQGELRPGEKVHEEQLCERFGVSRTPLREALKVLASEGVLQIQPHRGVIVTPITAEAVDELFPLMGALERLAGSLACVRATDADIARVRAMHDTMLGHYRRKEEAEYLRLNRLIHEAFFEIAGNPTLASFYQQVLTRIHAFRFVTRKQPEHWRSAVEEHKQIMKAFEARDATQLSQLLEDHVTGTTIGIARDAIGKPLSGNVVEEKTPQTSKAAAVRSEHRPRRTGLRD
jgi:DNA-binding GntR family transcriptional regulator